jgi:hypothetical protein
MNGPARTRPHLLGATLIALSAAWAIAPPAVRAEPTAMDWIGTRRLGMAGSGRALADSNDALYMNPGAISQWSRYVAEGGYANGWFRGAQLINLSIIDTKTTATGAGLAYTYMDVSDMGLGGPEGRGRSIVGHRVDLAVSHPVSENVWIGSTARYLFIDARDLRDPADPRFRTPPGGCRRVEPEPPEDAPDGDGTGGEPAAPETPSLMCKDTSGYNMDVGLLWKIVDSLSFGFVVENFIYQDVPDMPFRQTVALAWRAADVLALTYDTTMDLSDTRTPDFTYAVGMEVSLGEYFPVRVGYAYHQRRGRGEDDQHKLGAGISFVAPRLAIDFGYEQRFDQTDAITLSGGLRLFIDK